MAEPRLPIIGIENLSPDIQARVLLIGEIAVKKLASKIADQAEKNAPVGKYPPEIPGKNGKTRKISKLTEKSKPGYGGTIAGSLQVVKSKLYKFSYLAVAGHWTSHFMEFGTSPHKMPTISYKKGHTMAFVGRNGAMTFAKSINHPGNKAKPFLTPAAERAEDFLQEVITELNSEGF